MRALFFAFKSSHSLSNNRGNAALMAAFIVSGTMFVLGTMSQMTARQTAQENVQRLNHRESFYAGETVAWHNYVRNKDSFVAPGSKQSDERYVASIPTNYTNGLPGALTASTYNTKNYKSGTPLNVKATEVFDTQKTVVRRQEPTNIRYSAPSGGRFCAGMSFGTNTRFYETCIKQATAAVVATTLPRAFAVGHPKIGYRVDGFYVHEYRYAFVSSGMCNSVTYSAKRPRLNADGTYNEIDLSKESPGTYKLCVVGISKSGAVQSDPTEYAVTIATPVALPAPEGILCSGSMGTNELKNNKHPSKADTFIACSPNHFTQKMIADLPGVKVKTVTYKQIVLGQDIDFKGINYKAITAIVSMGSTALTGIDLNGRGYRLKNLSISSYTNIKNYGPYTGTTGAAGIFAITNGLTARNLYIDDFAITPSGGSYDSGTHSATLAGSIQGNLDISNVYVVRSKAPESLLVATVYGGAINATNVTVSGKVTGSAGASGGIIGYLRATNNASVVFSNVYSEIAFDNNGGGLIGRHLAGGLTITNSGFNGTFERGTGYTGGLVGNISANAFGSSPASIIKDSYARVSLGTTFLSGPVGGLIGEVQSPLQLSNSVALVNLNAGNSDNVGGAIGRLAPVINSPATVVENVRVAGMVKARTMVGGFIGNYEGITQGVLSTFVRSNLFMGQIPGDRPQNAAGTTQNTMMGGFVGKQNGGMIQTSLAIADVKGTFSIGGFAGYMENYGSTIEDSGFYGSVTAESKGGYAANHPCSQIGGFVGRATGGVSQAIKSAYAVGDTVILTARTQAPTPNGYQGGAFAGEISNISLSNLFTVGTFRYPTMTTEGWMLTPAGTSNVISGTSGLSYYTADKSALCVPSTHKSPANCTQFTDVKNVYKRTSPTTSAFDSTKWTFTGTTLPYPKGL